MRLFRVTGSEKSGKILSVVIHPSGKYLAAATSNGRVEVWDVSTFKAAVTTNEIAGKLKPLRKLKHHDKDSQVNCVRFVPGTDILVSGDSMGKVYCTTKPWEKTAASELLLDLYDNNNNNNDELKSLGVPKRQASDEEDLISDIAVTERLMAIASLNNKVIIYDFQDKKFVAFLNEFQAPVKSMSFDSNNNYLMVISNNKTVYLYQYKLKLVGNLQRFYIKKVLSLSKILQRSLLTAKFSRFNWSPTGNLVPVPNGSREMGKNNAGITNNSKNSTIINFSSTNINHTYSLNNVTIIAMLSPLNNFKNISSLVGHKFSSLETVKFNPQLFKFTEPEDVNSAHTDTNIQIKNDRFYSVLATSGLDKTLVVWSTVIDKPIFISKDIATDTISEVDWTPDGLGLFVGSCDGSIIYLDFDESDIGIRATKDQLKLCKNEVQKLIPQLEDPPEWKKLQDDNKPEEVKKIEKEGTPSNQQGGGASSTADSKSKINTSSSLSTNYKTPVITKNGKKRVGTVLVSNGASSDPLLNRATSNSFSVSSTSNEFDRPSNTVPKKIIDKKRSRDSTDSNNNNNEDRNKKSKHYEPAEFLRSTIINPVTSFAKLRLAIPKVSLDISLKSSMNDSLSLNIKNGSGNEQKPTRISLITNERTFNSHDLLGEDPLPETKELFVDFVPKLVNVIAGGEGLFWALACLDGTVIVYSNAGKRLLPPIMLGCSLSFLESKGDYLLAVTSIGDLHVWNIKEKSCVIQPTNLYTLFEPSSKYQDDLLVKGEGLTLCSISKRGVPLVTLSNGNGYLYDKNMGSWCLISDSWWALGSNYWDSSSNIFGVDSGNRSISEMLPSGGPKNKSSVITLIESKTNEEIFKKRSASMLKKLSKVMLMKHGYENLESSISLAHLENRILIAETLQENQEFKELLMSYCSKLCELALKNKLIEVFQDLLGPKNHVELSDDDDDDDDDDEIDYIKANNKKMSTEWNPEICGLKKHDLLKDIILACAGNREVQRILVSYGKAIGLLSDEIL
ncbi:Hir2 protein [Saccharomycopsis crataegensis]|uniref:Protein HIR n=1 Tax=Saccharomycopsis crataegensis TaxID=43959 RepID=A0AAV5QLW0_9ASCO|nr:Hir2 protein [Saccharomycopsis crataegensis]